MKHLLYILGLFLLVISCKKEKTSWDSDWNTPLIHGTLTVNDLAFGNSVSQNTEGYASLFFDNTIFSFSLDTLIKLRDTTLIHKSASSISSLLLEPGSAINTTGIDQEYELGEIELKQVILKEGKLLLKIISPWQGKTTLTMTLPKTKDNTGAYFVKSYDIPAGSQTNTVEISDIIDLTDFDFDLTGTSGDLINNITADILVVSAEETNSFTVTNLDTVIISMSFEGLKPKYAKGYLGQYELSDTTTISIPQFNKIINGQLNLDSINLGLSVQNSFKLLSQSTIHLLKGDNTNTNNSVGLSFPLLNTSLNINPASGGFYDYMPSIFNIPIHSGNSNVLGFMQNLPNSVDIGYSIHINPFGNSSAGNDEYFPNSTFNLNLKGDFPLHFGLDNLTLVDTFSLKINDLDFINSGKIVIDYQNKFPIGAIAHLVLIDANNTILDTLTANSPIIGWQGSSTTSLEPDKQKATFNLSENSISNLRNSKQLVLQISFSTYQSNMIKLNVDDYFKFNLFSDLNLTLKL